MIMEIFRFSFDAVTPLILLVVLGYFLARWKVINDTFIDIANKFCFRVAFPASLFISITEIDLKAEVNWFLYALVIPAIVLTVLILVLAVPRLVKGNPQRGALIQGIYRGNFLLMGYPLARNFFGEAGVVPVTMLLPVVILLYNLIAVVLLEYYDQSSKGLNLKKVLAGVLTNPLIIGAAAGVVFSLLEIDLPVFIGRAVDDVAAIAYPMALILLGGQFKWGKLAGNGKMLVSAVAARMFLIPVLVIGTAALLGFRGPDLGAVFILFCAPTAVSSYIMARNMNSDADLAGQIILLTTVVSGFTFFAGAFLLRSLQLF
jgi:malate permease and related proteins